MQTSSHDLSPCARLPDGLRLQAAELAFEAMPQLYGPLRDHLLPILADEFLLEGTELADAVSIADTTVHAMVASYPAEEYQSRQRGSLHHALGTLDRDVANRLVAQLRTLSPYIPQQGLEGEYIARFAVRQGLRGSGLADRLMDRFLAKHGCVTLHVSSSNVRAMNFYRRHGFSADAENGQFTLLRRGG